MLYLLHDAAFFHAGLADAAAALLASGLDDLAVTVDAGLCVTDADRRGTSPKGLVVRGAHLVSAGIYAGLGLTAASLALGLGLAACQRGLAVGFLASSAGWSGADQGCRLGRLCPSASNSSSASSQNCSA